jgi:hypothetical protein
MKRALAVALLLISGSLVGCATAIIGGDSPSGQCKEADSRNCPKQETR